MSMGISAAHNDYRLAGSIAFADSAATPSRIQFFTAVYPTLGATLGATPAETPVLEIVLAVPCGEVVDHVLVLEQASSTGDLIMATATVVWARWVNGDGVLVADGTVTDSAGDGDFKLAGTDGTTLYAGARAILGASSLS